MLQRQMHTPGYYSWLDFGCWDSNSKSIKNKIFWKKESSPYIHLRHFIGVYWLLQSRGGVSILCSFIGWMLCYFLLETFVPTCTECRSFCNYQPPFRSDLQKRNSQIFFAGLSQQLGAKLKNVYFPLKPDWVW